MSQACDSKVSLESGVSRAKLSLMEGALCSASTSAIPLSIAAPWRVSAQLNFKIQCQTVAGLHLATVVEQCMLVWPTKFAADLYWDGHDCSLNVHLIAEGGKIGKEPSYVSC